MQHWLPVDFSSSFRVVRTVHRAQCTDALVFLSLSLSQGMTHAALERGVPQEPIARFCGVLGAGCTPVLCTLLTY